MNRFVNILTIATVVSASSQFEAQALIIDSFDSPGGGQTIADPTGVLGATTASSVSAGTVHGGDRDIIIERNIASGIFGTQLTINDAINGSLGSAGYTEFVGNDGRFEISWDGNSDTAPTGFAIDTPGAPSSLNAATGSGIGGSITNGGVNNYLSIEYMTPNSSIPFSVLIYSDTSDYSRYDGTFTSSSVGLLIDLLNPTSTGGIGANLESVEAIVLSVDSGSATTGSTLQLFHIQTTTVPEPTSIALLGMGACGLMGYGWRRKKKVVIE